MGYNNYINIIIMEDIKNKINRLFIKFITKSKKHPFFYDIETVNDSIYDYMLYKENRIVQETKYKFLPNIEQLQDKKEKHTVLTNEKLVKLDREIKNIGNYEKIFTIVTEISRYLLKSTASSNVFETFNKPVVMVIGSGPIGLFTACYLKFYYEDSIDVVIYDNRIKNPGFRKPYTRQRTFTTSSKYLSLILPKLYCWDSKNYINVNIFMLEYLLYSQAVLKYKIPIIYQDYSWDDYKRIINDNNIKVVFDCSGGRLKMDTFKNLNTQYLENMETINIKLNKKLKINLDKNIVELVEYKNDSKFIKNHFYGSITIYNKNGFFYKKYDMDVTTPQMLKHLTKYNKKFYTYNNMIKIINGIDDDIERNYLYSQFMIHKAKLINKKFYIDIWQIYIRHAVNVADIYNDTLIIKTGDSMFHSHFITGAGLNRTINLTVKFCNYINDLINE